MTSRRAVAAAMGVAVAMWLGVLTAARPAVVTATDHGPTTAAPVPPPPARLVDTGLYAAGEPGLLAAGVEPFAPQYPLWSDGLRKRRWIALPAGAVIDASDAFDWQFPVGTRLWKEFALGDRPVETRFFWRATADAWVAATYVWNADGTDATLAPAEGVPGVVEVAPGRRHSVPSRADCAACHGPNASSRVLGVNALQLSTDRDPDALHGEPLQPGMLTVASLADAGRFGPSRPAWVETPLRIATSRAEARPVLGYFAANCGMCHDGTPTIAGFDASLATRDLVHDGDAAVERLIETPTRWQAPGVPEGHTVLLRAGRSSESAIYLRMRSRSPSSQMAPLGSVVRDEQALAAVARWIDDALIPGH